MTYQSISEVVSNKACIGCGTCSFLGNDQVKMKFDQDGHYKPTSKNNSLLNNPALLLACPFAEEHHNESTIGRSLYADHCNYNELTGYYENIYAGYSYHYRHKTSSGGIITWILERLLEEKLVDEVIHVKDLDPILPESPLFNYSISKCTSDLKNGMKSKYYPIEMSDMLTYISQNDKRFVFVGLPCFCKSVRLLQMQNPVFKQRIKFVVGLVCGHLKSEYFAKSIALNLGMKPKELKKIDFRVKENSKKPSEYFVKVSSKETTLTTLNKNIIGGNWGLNFFRNPACNLCDDVFAETSDIVIGDAWIKPYNRDPLGTSILIVRDKIISKLLQDGMTNNQLYLDELSLDKAIKSQSSGLTDRRQGLKFRLWVFKKFFKRKVPNKRFMDKKYNITLRRKAIYLKRLFSEYISHKAFNVAKNAKSSVIFKLIIFPAFVLDYCLYPLKIRILLSRYLKKLLSLLRVQNKIL